MLYMGEIVRPDPSAEEGKRRGIIRTPSSAGSSAAFFFVVLLVVVAVAVFVCRVELRVERVNVVTGSVSSSSPRFLLDDIQQGKGETIRRYLGHHSYGSSTRTSG